MSTSPAPGSRDERPDPVRGFAASPAAATPLRRGIQARHRVAERDWILALADEAELSPAELAAAGRRARDLAEAVRRARRSAGGVDALMHEFSLSSEEGVALMCLAEALLRIPDDGTRDRLIRDKIGGGDWSAHLGRSPSLFVNAAAWGLLVTGKLVPTHSEQALGGSLRRLVGRGGAPVIRRATDLAIRMLGRQFVTGETIGEALAEASARERRGYRFSYDMLGEAAMTAADADRYMRAYAEATLAIGRASAGRGIYAGPGISIKLSALHPRYARSQRERVMAELLPRVTSLALLARSADIGLNIDAEEADRLDLSLDLLEALALDPALAGWDGLGFVVQAYGRRARPVIDWLADLGRRSGRRLMVRLVKGAYWDSEIKLAQLGGFETFPVFTRKAHTDVSYLACARAMLAAPDSIFPQFATHNAFTIGAVEAMAGAADYEFQCLHGMGEAIYDGIVGPAGRGRPVRVYAPVGPHETLLAYLVRRLLENGANSSFVSQVVDETVPLERLVEDPVARVRQDGGHPHAGLRPPPALFPGRANSRGFDLASEPALTELGVALRTRPQGPEEARGQPVRNPASGEIVGRIADISAEEVGPAVGRAAAALPDWASLPAERRAALLERWAEALEEQRLALYGLLMREAGKTARNAVGELREAVDFCRYYAAEARAGLAGTRPLGPVCCISPWNFPLAIFTGQVAAALVAGNPVLAKPAEQTPLVAREAVRLAHEAGIPPDVLQLLPGPGETVGAALVADPRVMGIVFTGSTAVAKGIERTLAGRPDSPVLIAETGGLNAMIVDSSALPEQVVADAVESAFDSAGQRCSALRLLCLQEDVAGPIIAMLEGAMRELRTGSPLDLSTDVGPVIDGEARDGLERHVAAMRARGCRVVQGRLAAETGRGTFVPPTLIEIPEVEALDREVFGPVLHVVRFRAEELPPLVGRINAAGYGLTGGLHTRIDEVIAEVASSLRVGNLYVNRNLVGAVVGSQPFGGEGLSGTGPKAGGPFYLHALVRNGRPAPAVALRLPGPTGEENGWSLHPRGPVACLGPAPEALRAQAEAALAAGNRALLPDTEAGRAVAADLSRDDVALSEDPAGAEPLGAVLADLPPEPLVALRRRIAARPGAILPVIGPDHSGGYPGWRLVAERAVSVNTAAAGGNAALLALDEGGASP
ncbi:bifunctional proline dehydrogenase/L-glutamate gamma-semialdehyde dehydrogenase PutA [Enterovirga sp.]|uniref:bifunctional proline dehydrogenase/L-glutamate gamma-semialdehyde dehydrogenase PutA n=1 Tax=Enterovirga sp. TaxID=2026350 RepID=UPI00261E7923|nr:bifunctional proline dehydrogenase/L-glutamate gamma-semialdehyde dehydrogenase PutA [Enterovirga sp.]MDB5590679.1 trifunctional transcriptional regulator/proline dehydrogenase/L-glutamate gamma-semialdehyde [Enterovirga sp.]